MPVTFEPTGDRVVTIPIDPNAKVGDLHLPVSAAEKLNAGTARVIAVGPGLLCTDGTRAPMQCRVGDRVIYDAKIAVGMPFDGIMHHALLERDVVAVIRGLDVVAEPVAAVPLSH